MFSVLSQPTATAGEKTKYFALFFSVLFTLLLCTITLIGLHLGPLLEWLHFTPGVMDIVALLLVVPIFTLFNFFYRLFARHWWVGFVVFGLLYGALEIARVVIPPQ